MTELRRTAAGIGGFPCTAACVLGVRVVWDALFAFVTEAALIRASSLAFTSVLSLVPLMTVGLRAMSFFGVTQPTRDEFEGVLAQYLLPAQSRDVVNLMLSASTQVTQNIGAPGLASFCVTLVLLARELEGHIQKTCGVRGSLATSLLHHCIPAFLLWVFVAWCCVLFGVQVAAKAQPPCGRRPVP